MTIYRSKFDKGPVEGFLADFSGRPSAWVEMGWSGLYFDSLGVFALEIGRLYLDRGAGG